MVKIKELKKRNGLAIFLDILFNRTPQIVRPKVLFSQYNRIILLAPVWAGKIASPMKAFIKLERDNFKEYSFITLCGDGGNDNISSELTRAIGKKPGGILELKISDLLKSRSERKFTSSYKINEEDLHFFNDDLERFLQYETKELVNTP